MTRSARATAPASIGNIGVGFDVLGHAFHAAHDTVTARRENGGRLRLGSVTGTVKRLPSDVEDNACLAAAHAVMKAAGESFGLVLEIEKGIPLSAGMGGSGASAVAGAAAANALLDRPFDLADLLPFALAGEKAASGSPAWDNVLPALLGGMVLAARLDPPLVRTLPAPKGLMAVLVLPGARIETRAAREVLGATVTLETAVEHSRRIAAFVAGCAANDLKLIEAGLEDLLIEPQRAKLLPCLPMVKHAAKAAGALGCSLSGSGPAIFAWAREDDAQTVREAMEAAVDAAGLTVKGFTAPIGGAGVQVEAG